MIDQLMFFNANESLAFVRSDFTEAIHYEEKFSMTCELPYDPEKMIERGMYVGFFDLDEVFQLFVIEKTVENIVRKRVSFEATHAAVCEMCDEQVEDKRPQNCQASTAVEVALSNSIWSLGNAETTGLASNHFYYQSVLSCLNEVQERYGCVLKFRVVVSGNRITGRYVDIYNDIGADDGARLELRTCIDDMSLEYDDSEVATALYGRGKGEDVGTNANGDPTYGRRITFSGVVWSKASGAPLDKPAGQEWIEDPDATAAYGRGTPRRKRTRIVVFEDCTDENQLLQLTYDELQRRKEPKVTLKLTIRDLEGRYGYKDIHVRLGDYATVIIDDTRAIKARITSIARNLKNPSATKLVIGNTVVSIVDMQVSTDKKVSSIDEQIEIAGGIVSRNPELLNGMIDLMVTKIFSSGTNISTASDGSLIFTSSDGLRAVRITGSGILLANTKTSTGDWNWRTAIDGSGIATNELTAGTINASLIKWLGTGTYMDGTTLKIQHPNLTNDTSTELGLDGMKMKSGGKVIGGLYKSGNRVISAVQCLTNPDQDNFRVSVAPQDIGGEQAGMHFIINGFDAGSISVFSSGTEENSGMRHDVRGQLGLYGKSVNVSASDDTFDGVPMAFSSGGDIAFYFYGYDAAGTYRQMSLTMSQIYRLFGTD